MRIAISQFNPHVGAIDENTSRILAQIDEARSSNCDLIIFPELAICGYSPLDLLWHDGLIEACEQAIQRITVESSGIGVIVGGIAVGRNQAPSNRDNISSLSDGALTRIANRAFLMEDGILLGHVDKQHLPSYDVYCEKRHFTAGEGTSNHSFGDRVLGINICEDLWIDEGPTDLQASLGADWIINLSASPYYAGKPTLRHRLATRRAKENRVGLVYANLVGGQDEVVFDGGSFVVDDKGRLIFQAPHFQEGLYVVDLEHPRPLSQEPVDEMNNIRQALVLGIRDYVAKNGFERVIIGLSGGIDSAVVTALATEALGAGNVLCAYLPSEFSSKESEKDARTVADNLGVTLESIDITKAHHALREALPQSPQGLVDENLQPRIRGTLLMALANQHQALVLCPGNKTEIAVGYSTLYGDTVGALAPIADLLKRQVVELARTYGNAIPNRILTKPPSAELRANQQDEDDLPPYALLDAIVQQAIEGKASRQNLIEQGFDEETVDDILRRIRVNEHKRRQLPPGLKVSPKAFGVGRRMPLTNGYRA